MALNSQFGVLLLFRQLETLLSRVVLPNELGPLRLLGPTLSHLLIRGRRLWTMSSAPDNHVLNSVEVGVDSTPASITEMLYSRVFDRVPDVSDPDSLELFVTWLAPLSSNPPAARTHERRLGTI